MVVFYPFCGSPLEMAYRSNCTEYLALIQALRPQYHAMAPGPPHTRVVVRRWQLNQMLTKQDMNGKSLAPNAEWKRDLLEQVLSYRGARMRLAVVVAPCVVVFSRGRFL
jgi:hypothetical protein